MTKGAYCFMPIAFTFVEMATQCMMPSPHPGQKWAGNLGHLFIKHPAQ